MPIICVANQKGGVGKTTTAAALADGLSEHNKRVLLVDWDPQGSLTISMGIEPDTLKQTCYDLLSATLKGENNPIIFDIIQQTNNKKVDLLPSNLELSQSQLDLVGIHNREMILREMLQPARQSYDYILIDCLPSLGLLTINALTAADKVVIPVQADFLAMKGLAQLLYTIIRVKDKLNQSLEIFGILFTMTNSRTLHSREVVEVTKKAFNDKIRVFDTVIPNSVRFKEAPAVGESILTYAARSEGARAYRLLTEEVMK